MDLQSRFGPRPTDTKCILFHHKGCTQKLSGQGLHLHCPRSAVFPAGMFTPYCCRRSPKHGDLTGPACLDDLNFLVDPPGVEPAHPQHRFCLPIGCSGFPPSVYTHLISELSAYCVGLRQARAFTSPKFWAAATSGFQHQAAAPHQAHARYTDAQ